MKQILTLLCLLAFCLTGCSGARYPAPRAISEYLIPFCIGSFRLLEKDSHGRCLYSCSSENSTTVYIITQKVDKSYVYCFEEYCYTFGEPTAIFKELNDWEQPPAADQPHLTAIKPELSGIAEKKATLEKKIPAALKAHAGITAPFSADILLTAEQKPIYIARLLTEENRVGKSYIFTLDSTDRIQDMKELTGEPEDWAEQIADFKREVDFSGLPDLNGNYGTEVS